DPDTLSRDPRLRALAQPLHRPTPPGEVGPTGREADRLREDRWPLGAALRIGPVRVSEPPRDSPVIRDAPNEDGGRLRRGAGRAADRTPPPSAGNADHHRQQATAPDRRRLSVCDAEDEGLVLTRATRGRPSSSSIWIQVR